MYPILEHEQLLRRTVSFGLVAGRCLNEPKTGIRNPLSAKQKAKARKAAKSAAKSRRRNRQ